MSDITMDDSFGAMKEDQDQGQEAGSPAIGDRQEGGQEGDEGSTKS